MTAGAPAARIADVSYSVWPLPVTDRSPEHVRRPVASIACRAAVGRAVAQADRAADARRRENGDATEEDEYCNLRLSEIARWQVALGVPIAALLSEPEMGLGESTLLQTRLVRLMKTAQAILEAENRTRTARLAQNMINQLLEIMPELRDVTSWPREGSRPTFRELGLAARQLLLPPSRSNPDGPFAG